MKLSSILQVGIFLERPNRFTAWIDINSVPTMVHVPNSGRMGELLRKGTTVLLTPIAGTERKTNYDLSLVKFNHTLIAIDSRMPTVLVHEAFANGQLEQFSNYTWTKREVQFSDSRLDMVIGNDELCYIETKSVTLVENDIALFPDAPTSRGVRHINALTRAVNEGHRAAIILVVQRNDVSAFSTNYKADPQFSDSLSLAKTAGVEVYAYRCRVSLEEVILTEPLHVHIQNRPEVSS